MERNEMQNLRRFKAHETSSLKKLKVFNFIFSFFIKTQNY